MPMIQFDVSVELRTALKRYALDHGLTMRDAGVRALAALVGFELPQAGESAAHSPAAETGATGDIGGDTSLAPLQGVSFDES